MRDELRHAMESGMEEIRPGHWAVPGGEAAARILAEESDEPRSIVITGNFTRMTSSEFNALLAQGDIPESLWPIAIVEDPVEEDRPQAE